jgi:hypothetical protein
VDQLGRTQFLLIAPKALGITAPQTLLPRAEEVMQ